jgi:UDPglucose 6-dehydrogenase
MNNGTQNNGNKSRIGIVGSGVVGSATGIGFVNNDFDVSFIDTNKKRVETLIQQGYKSLLPEDVDPNKIDAFFVSVPTYTGIYENGLQYIKESAMTLGRWIARKKDYTLVVFRSTIAPGTIENMVIPLIEELSGKKVEKDFDVCFNPEYLRERSAASDFKNPWVLTIGANNENAGKRLENLYFWVNCPIRRLTVKEAEMQKFVHNLFNANKISFFNEMRYVCEKLGINSDRIFSTVIESAEAMWNHAYGTADMGAYGGTCLPKDTNAMYNFARERLDLDLKLLKAVIDVNNDVSERTKFGKLMNDFELKK